jgi:hypothetical protein
LSSTSVLDVLSPTKQDFTSNNGNLPAMLEKALSLEDMFVDHFGDGGADHDPSRDAEYFILTFDVRNTWRQPIEVEFDVYDGKCIFLPRNHIT